MSALLRERFDTSSVEAYHVLDEGQRARVHFSAHSAEGLPEVSLRDLEEEAIALARTWDDELAAALERKGGRVLASTWASRFPDYYKGYTKPETAAVDIACFRRLDAGESFVVSLHPIGGARTTRVALYKRGAKIELSQAMPMLEDLGLRVIEEISTRLRGPKELWVQEFRVLGPGERPLDLDDVGDRVAEAIAAVYRGDDESDPLNQLVITAGLDRGQVAILRAYRKYRQRIGSRFTEGYQNDVLVANSPITAKLVRYFELRFDPDIETDEAAERDLRDEILADLEEVASIDHDRILRNQLGAVDATLRTSAFKEGRGATAFKLRSADVPAIPMPAPEYEIYVYSQDLEGIHLRGGKIARGGIRHSDRMDYRTEVYGLMRAQLTKNAIIVPAGAKGGFIVKRSPIDREAVEQSYVTYIRSLLDVTDNLVDGAVVHPDRVRVRDEHDTYLVVAADKGTATFSDTANRVAAEYGFWLDDAFASGGSVGYDHKKLGITARGAWESVKRHFRELGLDPATDEFTAVGIGDMSGDVFGNGMLLSDKIKLLAAYDHRNVFVDPDPDPAASFAERRRLFELAGSSWEDYSRDVLSEGGGVCKRDAKWIESPGARPRAARHRRGARSAERGDPGDPAGAGRPAVERRHRHRGEGRDRDRRRRQRPLERRDPRQRRRAARTGGRRGRQPRVHASRAGRVRRPRRAHQRRLHRQLGRRRLLRPRGQPEDPARTGRASRRADAARARRADGGGHRGRGRARALRLVPAGADHRPGGRAVGRADVRLRGPDRAARGDRPARPREREPARRRRDHRAPPRRTPDGAARAGDPRRLRQAVGRPVAGGERLRGRPVAGARPARVLPRTR